MNLGIRPGTQVGIVVLETEVDGLSHKVIYKLADTKGGVSYIGIELDVIEDRPVYKTYLHSRDIEVVKLVFKVTGKEQSIRCGTFSKDAHESLGYYNDYLSSVFINKGYGDGRSVRLPNESGEHTIGQWRVLERTGGESVVVTETTGIA